MKTTLMTSALAITAVLAYGSIAAAQDVGPTSAIDNSFLLGSANGNDNSVNDSNNNLELGVDIADSLNDNSTDYDDSFNDESDNSNNAEDSFNDNSDNSNNAEDSFNDNSDNSNNAEDSFNTDNSTDYEDSFNDNSDTEDSYNTDNSLEVEDSYNSSIEDSYNTDNSQTHLALSVQILNSSISDIGVNMGDAGLFAGDANGDINTGAISQDGGAFAAFAGIQTVSNNTGLASSGQAATAISANANVTFGNAK